ncbi:MAG: hypothetical protein ACE145_20205 [Terriglobia bacterium]
MAETSQNPISDLISRARERFAQELDAQSEQLQKLEGSLQELRGRQKQLEDAFQQHLDALAKVELPGAPAAATGDSSLENVLSAVRELMTATLPEQVQEVLTDQGEKLGVRAAVFDVRGKAVWGASARGFAGLSEKVFRGLVVPLNQDNPFRTCYETGGHVDANVDLLKKNRNVLDKLRPGSDDAILLLPIRSAGSVSAIFYADGGGLRRSLPVDALKILAEFAGAQLDRLMAFSGGIAEAPRGEAAEAPVEEVPVEAVEAEPVEEVSVSPVAEAEPAPVLGETIPAVEEVPPPPVPVEAAAPVAGFDIAKLSEEEQKGHRDAKRFAKLLVSEIELYNKAKVADGRKNADLYKRLKADIDRSRQTYEKRFGKTVGKQYDYFHEELVRTLAGSESSLLGAGYPGPSV